MAQPTNGILAVQAERRMQSVHSIIQQLRVRRVKLRGEQDPENGLE